MASVGVGVDVGVGKCPKLLEAGVDTDLRTKNRSKEATRGCNRGLPGPKPIPMFQGPTTPGFTRSR